MRYFVFKIRDPKRADYEKIISIFKERFGSRRKIKRHGDDILFESKTFQSARLDKIEICTEYNNGVDLGFELLGFVQQKQTRRKI